MNSLRDQSLFFNWVNLFLKSVSQKLVFFGLDPIWPKRSQKATKWGQQLALVSSCFVSFIFKHKKLTFWLFTWTHKFTWPIYTLNIPNHSLWGEISDNQKYLPKAPILQIVVFQHTLIVTILCNPFVKLHSGFCQLQQNKHATKEQMYVWYWKKFFWINHNGRQSKMKILTTKLFNYF